MSEEMIETVDGSGGTLRGLVFGLIFLVCLVLFTLVKIPQPKIHAWILGTLNQEMNPIGIQATAEEGRIVLGLGLKYEMSGVRLTMVDTQKVLKFSRLEVSPNLVALIQQKLGGHFLFEEGSGTITGDVSVKNGEFEADVRIENLNLGRLGILPFATGLEGSADVKGSLTFSGSTTALSGTSGKVNLTLAKIVIDPQKFKGFDIPRTTISDGVFDIDIATGKATINSARLGKAGGTDDLQGTATGEIKLGRTMDSSDASLRLKFGFSEHYRLEKTISLLDSLLGMFKRPDATFAVRLSGPLNALQPAPDQP